MGIQSQRNSPDLVTQKLEDRPKNVVLKRVRTSIAETRAYRSNGLSRQSPVMTKNRDVFKDCGAGSHLVEEKIRSQPAGGEGWERKTKRKRSVGTLLTRPIDSDGDFKRKMHHSLSREPGLQSCDGQSFRSGASNGTGGINNLDDTSLPVGSGARATPGNEREKVTLSRDLTAGLTKQRLLIKGNNKLLNCEDNSVDCPSPVIKGKASRAPRTGSMIATNSALNNQRVSGTLESYEQLSTGYKIPSIGGASNRKRAMRSESSSPPMAQWVGQRPQKISRCRRANLVSPVLNHDEMQTSPEGCSPSDFGARLTSSGTNSSILSRVAGNGTQQLKVKLENVSSPARFPQRVESCAGENMPKEKGTSSGELEEKGVNAVQNVGSSVMLTKKSKLVIKEEIGDGVRRQGRSRRGSSFSKARNSPVREKLDNAAFTKPPQSARPRSDKNGSKSGCPLEKLSDNRGFSRLGNVPNSGSPNINGESDDDREELLAAANLACNASHLACSSQFWEKMEPMFASINLEGRSYLTQQLKYAEELQESLSQMFDHGSSVLADIVHEEVSVSHNVSGERNKRLGNQIGSKDSASIGELVDQFRDTALVGALDSGRRFNKVTPLYHRVLSALIVEDDIEEYEEIDAGRNVLLQNATGDRPYDACLLIDAEPRREHRMEFESESMFGVQIQEPGTGNILGSCNGSIAFHRSPSTQNPPCKDVLLVGESLYKDSDAELLAGISRNDLEGPQSSQKKVLALLPFDCQYEHMCIDDKLLLELQSIGLYPETVPDLDDREDEVLNHGIVQLKRGLHEQIGKMKTCLEKLCKAIQGGREKGWDLEQIAMSRLVELAYKKLLATRGSSAAKMGVAKLPKHVALAFVKRTLARCMQFEDSGTSCFHEPALRDIIFGAPPRGNEAEATTCTGLEVANSSFLCNADGCPSSTFEILSDQAFAKKGPISNRGNKKKAFVDDVAGSAALSTASTFGSSLLGGMKEKRGKREGEKDTTTRNSVAKAGHSTMGCFKGDHKTKMKPKQKRAQLSTSGIGFISNFTETTQPLGISASSSTELVKSSGHRKREVGFVPLGSISEDSPKDVKEPMDFANLQLHELDLIEELSVGADLGRPQEDLCPWLNFDEDGLQDYDSMGLEIPMDDLSELNMF